MDLSNKNISEIKSSESGKQKVEELMKENLELMYNIQKNRTNFCQLVGGC